MNDSAISFDHSGNMSVDTYEMSDYSIGTNDFGQALYDIGGVQMTEAQAEDNASYFMSEDGDDYEYEDGYHYYEEEDTLPDAMIEGLDRINAVLGGGAADWIASEVLGIGEDRMSEVLQGTHMEQGEVQSYVNSICIDMAANVGMDHEMLMEELGNDINTVRSMGSARGMEELHQIIADAVNGEYHASMTRWDRLRGVLSTYR